MILVQKFLKSSLHSTILNVVSAFLGIILSLLITNLTSMDEFGVYQHAISIVQIMTVIVVFGVPTYTVKNWMDYSRRGEGSTRVSESALSLPYAILTFIIIFVLIYSLLYPSVLVGLSFSIPTYKLILFVLMLVSVELSQGILKGAGRIVLGQSFRLILGPFFLSVLVVISARVGKTITAEFLVDLSIGIYLILFLVSACYSKIHSHVRIGTLPREEVAEMRNFLSLRLVDILTSRLPFVLIATFQGVESLAIYAVVDRFASVTGLVRSAISVPFQSSLAETLRKYGSKDKRTSGLIVAMSIVSFVTVAFSYAVYLASGELLLSFFGKSYVEGFDLLMILTGAKLVDAFFGPSLNILMMSGMSKSAANIKLFSLVVYAVILIPSLYFFELLGAGYANLLAHGFTGLAAALSVHTKLGINPTILSISRRRS